MMLLPILALLTGRVQAPPEFYSFLAKRDPSYGYTVRSKDKDVTIDLTSQVWQGSTWTHTMIYRRPVNSPKNGVAILYITGDGPKPADYSDLALISAMTNMPIATLFNIPNQPLWGMKEDDLIAYSFDKYLETNDPTWPLLFPMAKSAIRAMDAIQSYTKNSDDPITKFVVTGASKRGWTTWFVGAARDARVIGIAPMVIDNLNVSKQMPHQLEQWGKYSEQIEEYTKRGLQAKLATPEGQRLGRMIDPYSYLSEIHVPTMIVTGANDPYWAVDAMSLYWNDLKMPHWASIVPNAGHDLGDKIQAVTTVGAFAASLSGAFKMPQLTWNIARPETTGKVRTLTIRAESKDQPFESVQLLMNTSDTLDFRSTKWSPIADLHETGRVDNQSMATVKVSIPADANVAVLAEAHYKVGKRGFTLSRPVMVFPKG
jgi:PhoPQ-activated pathogenicity-related protein